MKFDDLKKYLHSWYHRHYKLYSQNPTNGFCEVKKTKISFLPMASTNMLSGTMNLGLAVAQGFKFMVCKIVSPRQGIRAFKNGSDSKNTLGWTKSMLGMFSQTIWAKDTLRISLSCSRVKEDGGISFSYQYRSPVK